MIKISLDLDHTLHAMLYFVINMYFEEGQPTEILGVSNTNKTYETTSENSNYPVNKLPRRYAGLLMGALMSIIMSFLMSFVITFLNIGFTHVFLHKWMIAFTGALPVSLPISLIVVPAIKAFVEKITI